ncbi:MAG TPA: hypothetical protein PL110_17550 [Candidatus Eremiobacteraeota bacterium]|nr:MAG: hypothetical protein BWY64_03165 [bacterium ADurb.Bin363]HPZ09901.1 hypothetical protein [Candidatus Eremiobacteraeota bacterium]
MNNLLTLLILLLFFVSCGKPEESATPAPTPVIEHTIKLTISSEEIKKDSMGDILSVKVKATLKNVSKKEVTITVSECNPDHFYWASINGGNFFLPIAIIHCRYCGIEKTFKPGEELSTVIEIKKAFDPIRTIQFRYPLEKNYLESNKLNLIKF